MKTMLIDALFVSSGYICISLPSERLEELDISMMVNENEDPHRTAYTVTVDYKHGTFAPRLSIPQSPSHSCVRCRHDHGNIRT